MVDNEIRSILIKNYNKALEILQKNESTVHKMAQALLERETLNKQEIDSLVRGEELSPYQKQLTTLPIIIEKTPNQTPQVA